MNMPFALQLANGWTSLAVYSNAISSAVMVPIIILLTQHFGAPGVADCRDYFYGGYLLFVIPITYRRLLPGETRRWYLEDVGYPLLAAAAIARGGTLVDPWADVRAGGPGWFCLQSIWRPWRVRLWPRSWCGRISWAWLIV